jgi:hypothetical protein
MKNDDVMIELPWCGRPNLTRAPTETFEFAKENVMAREC